MISQLQSLVENFGLSGWSIHRESEMEKQGAFNEAIEQVQLSNELETGITDASRDPNYFMSQYSHSIYFETKKDCDVKIGWCFGDEKGGNEQFSEAGFDAGYSDSFSSVSDAGDLKFIYTTPGRTFDSKASRSAPYVCLDESKRLLLFDTDKNRDKLELFDDMRAGAKSRSKVVYTRFEQQARTIVDTYNWLVGLKKIEANPIEQLDWQTDLMELLHRCDHGVAIQSEAS